MKHWYLDAVQSLSSGLEQLSEFWLLLYVLMEIIGIFFALESIFKSRTSQGAIAWALGLVFLPPLVVPIYLLFGQRRFYGYVEARRKGDLEIQRIAQRLLAEMSQHFSLPGELPAGMQLLEKLALMPFTQGNQVNLLINGERIFQEIFSAIDRAEDYILVQFYIVRDDRLGRKLLERLATKAQQGVRHTLALFWIFETEQKK